VLPRLVDRVCGLEAVDHLREPVCAGLHGRVVELGFGSGLNVRHYPEAVASVIAVEPSDLAWHLAGERVAASPVPVLRGGLDGERLALPDDSVDCVLSTFTLCTIPDVRAALAEVARVLRPGGTLHFVEHGRAPDPGVVRWQRRLGTVWTPAAGGCHLDRPIDDLVRDAGLRIDALDSFYGAGPRPFGYFYLGRASAR
jgi:ubiquinone/menaquinone biosynthesis C-methylase UbiE